MVHLTGIKMAVSYVVFPNCPNYFQAKPLGKACLVIDAMLLLGKIRNDKSGVFNKGRTDNLVDVPLVDMYMLTVFVEFPDVTRDQMLWIAALLVIVVAVAIDCIPAHPGRTKAGEVQCLFDQSCLAHRLAEQAPKILW